MSKKLSVLVALLCLTFFNGGCTAEKRKELMDEAKAYVEEKLKEAAPTAFAKAKEYIDQKMKELEDKKKGELDLSLAEFKLPDGTVKTWKSFDADGDGSLSTSEIVSCGKFVAEQRAKGGGSNGAAGGAAAALVALGLIAAGKKGVGAIAKKVGPVVPVVPKV